MLFFLVLQCKYCAGYATCVCFKWYCGTSSCEWWTNGRSCGCFSATLKPITAVARVWSLVNVEQGVCDSWMPHAICLRCAVSDHVCVCSIDTDSGLDGLDVVHPPSVFRVYYLLTIWLK